MLQPALRTLGLWRRAATASRSWHDSAAWKLYDYCYRGDQRDLFVVSFQKSGTTLVQNLIYQLMTDGVFAFEHISDFSRFLERDSLTTFLRTGATIDEWPRPHVIKTHLPYDRVPKGPGQYIYVMRNGLDVAVSTYYQALRAGYVEPFSTFFEAMTVGKFGSIGVSWFDHVRDWIENRASLNVCYVTFEDLVGAFEPTARRIATQCRLHVDDEQWPRIARNCSFDVMRQHEQKFDDFAVFRGDPEDRHFIRRGRAGGWRALVDDRMLAAFHAEFERKLGKTDVPPSLRPAVSTATDVTGSASAGFGPAK